MNEEWKDIEGYEGIYQISTLGRVKSLKRTVNSTQILQERFLTPIINKTKTSHGYVLHQKNKVKKFTTSRLVFNAFIGNTKRGEIVKFKDGNNTNFSPENLYKTDFSDLMEQRMRSTEKTKFFNINIRVKELFKNKLKTACKGENETMTEYVEKSVEMRIERNEKTKSNS